MTRITIGIVLGAAIAASALPAAARVTSPLPTPRPVPEAAAPLAPPSASLVPLPAARPGVETEAELVPMGDPLRAPLPDEVGAAAPEDAPPPPPRAATPADLAPAPATEISVDRALAAVLPAPAAGPEDAAGDAEATPAPMTLAMMAVPEIAPGLPAPGSVLPEAGSFCRDPRLVGRVMPTFVGASTGCGIVDPVEISAAAGIPFSREAQVDCTTARAVADWIMGVVQPAAREHLGTRVTEVDVVGSYVCRTRNHVPGARLSEHARGRAVDIAGFRLADGRRIDVLTGWRSGATRDFFRAVWRGACGGFGTVLGPESDRHHRDHLHFDTARYRTGAYCR